MRSNVLRSEWKPWTWSMRSWFKAIFVGACILPIIIRWSCLWFVPDLTLPFDVNRVVQEDTPDTANAFPIYSSVQKLIAIPVNTSDVRTVGDAAGKDANIDAKMSPTHSIEDLALAEYIRAGEIQSALGPSLKTLTYTMNLDFHQEQRKLARHFDAIGKTSIQNGELDKAWSCFRANLLSSLHTEKPPLAICNLVGVAIRGLTLESVVAWASHSKVSAERLTAARLEIEQIYSRRGRVSDVWMAEYVCFRNTSRELSFVDILIENSGSAPSSLFIQLHKRALLWIIGQPELADRIYRQLLVNNSDELDKPLPLRQRIALKNDTCVVFDTDPAKKRSPGQLTADQLIQLVESSSPALQLSRRVLPAMAVIDHARLRDEARMTATRVVLAAQAFRRMHGEFPETIAAVVPKFLDQVPVDPMDEKGMPILYRRNEDGTAIVWSVGPNGVDDHGNVDPQNSLDVGYLIRLDSWNENSK